MLRRGLARLRWRTKASWSSKVWILSNKLQITEYSQQTKIEPKQPTKAESGKQEIENAKFNKGVFGLIEEHVKKETAKATKAQAPKATKVETQAKDQGPIVKVLGAEDFNLLLIGATSADLATIGLAAVMPREWRDIVKFHKIHTHTFPSTVHPQTFALESTFGQEIDQQSIIQKIFMTAVRLLMSKYQVPIYNPSVQDMRTIMNLVAKGELSIEALFRDKKGVPLMPLDPKTFRHSYFNEFISRALITSTLEGTGVYSSLLRIAAPKVFDYQKGIIMDTEGRIHHFPLLGRMNVIVDAHNYQRLPEAFKGKVTGNSGQDSLPTKSVNDFFGSDHSKLKDQTVVAIGGGPSIAWLIREFLLHQSGPKIGKLVVGLNPKTDTNKIMADLQKLNPQDPEDQKKALKILFPDFIESNINDMMKGNILKAIQNGSLVIVSQTDQQTKITKTDQGMSGEAVNILTGKVVKFDSTLPVFAAAGNETQSQLEHVGKPSSVTVLRKQPQGLWMAPKDVPMGSSPESELEVTQLLLPNQRVEFHRFGQCLVDAYITLFKLSGVEVPKEFFAELGQKLLSILTTPTMAKENPQQKQENSQIFYQDFNDLVKKHFPDPEDQARFKQEWAKINFAYQEKIATFVDELLSHAVPESPRPL